MCESTVKSIKVYVEELRNRPRTLASSNVKISPVLNFRPCLIFVGRLGRRTLNTAKKFTYEIFLIRKFPDLLYINYNGMSDDLVQPVRR